MTVQEKRTILRLVARMAKAADEDALCELAPHEARLLASLIAQNWARLRPVQPRRAETRS